MRDALRHVDVSPLLVVVGLVVTGSLVFAVGLAVDSRERILLGVGAVLALVIVTRASRRR
jgi:hypothetical protein